MGILTLGYIARRYLQDERVTAILEFKLYQTMIPQQSLRYVAAKEWIEIKEVFNQVRLAAYIDIIYVSQPDSL